MLRIPFLIEVNGIEEEIVLLGRRLPPWRPITSRLRRRMYRSAGATVTVSDRLASHLERIHGLPSPQVVTIPNGVDLDRFSPGDRAESQASLGLVPGLWIAFVGNLVPWQGVGTLLRAFGIVLESRPDTRLAIVGDGILRGSLEALARQLGVAERVTFTGTVPHERVPHFIVASNVCVAPFTRERNEWIGLSPLKLYEYLACGRPVVASDVPGVREVLSNSGAGIIVPTDDDQALSAALVSLLEDPARANAMGNAGRTFAVNECSWNRAAMRVNELIQSVTRDPKERGRNP
jgi:glycosyltransferase involved in cell wall biosynthesis